MSPDIPGPAPALDLDAVSDYVADTYDGLALDYGPVPDNDAARDYAKALDCDTPLRPAEAPHPAEAPGPEAPSPPGVPGPGPAPAPGPAPGAAVGTGPAGEDWAPEPAAAWVTPAMYWRRRTVALAVGIAVLTFLAWAVGGVLHGSGAGQPAGHRGRSSAHQHAGGHRSAPRTGRAHTTGAGPAPAGAPPGITHVLAMPVARHGAPPPRPRRRAGR